MKKQRKHYTPEEKVAILRRHLVEGVPISDLCDELGLQPTVFYRWQKESFENGAAAFQHLGTWPEAHSSKQRPRSRHLLNLIFRERQLNRNRLAP
jgi:transposase-like protein